MDGCQEPRRFNQGMRKELVTIVQRWREQDNREKTNKKRESTGKPKSARRASLSPLPSSEKEQTNTTNKSVSHQRRRHVFAPRTTIRTRFLRHPATLDFTPQPNTKKGETHQNPSKRNKIPRFFFLFFFSLSCRIVICLCAHRKREGATSTFCFS